MLWLFDWLEPWNALEVFSALCLEATTKGKKCIRNIGWIPQDLLFLTILVLQKTKLEESPTPLPFPLPPSQVKPRDFEETKWWGSEIISTYPWPCGGTRALRYAQALQKQMSGDWIEASGRPMTGSRAGPSAGAPKLLTGTYRRCRGAALSHPEIPVIPLPLPQLTYHPG